MMRRDDMSKPQYRKNVAVVVTNEQRQILLGHPRGGKTKSWQLPQGGIQACETPEQALRRELQEKTGLVTYEILGQTSEWIRYDWPEHLRQGTTY